MAEQARPRLTLVDEALAETPAASKAEENAIRSVLARYAPSIAKKTRAAVTVEITQRLGVQKLEDASETAQLRKERDERIGRDEEAKHVKAGFWRGFAIGGMIVGALLGTGAALYTANIINPAFDAAARMQMQQNVVDTVVRQGQRQLPQ